MANNWLWVMNFMTVLPLPDLHQLYLPPQNLQKNWHWIRLLTSLLLQSLSLPDQPGDLNPRRKDAISCEHPCKTTQALWGAYIVWSIDSKCRLCKHQSSCHGYPDSSESGKIHHTDLWSSSFCSRVSLTFWTVWLRRRQKAPSNPGLCKSTVKNDLL